MIIGVAMLTGINATAQVNWQFQIGGMYSKKYGLDGLGEKSGSEELSGAILLQIPVKQQFFIETGLGCDTNSCSVKQKAANSIPTITITMALTATSPNFSNCP